MNNVYFCIAACILSALTHPLIAYDISTTNKRSLVSDGVNQSILIT